MNFDPVAFGKAMGKVLREAVAGVETSLAPRIKALEDRPPPEKGEPGASVTAQDVLPALREDVDAFLKSLPVPKDGRSLTLEEVLPALEQRMESRMVQWQLDFERRAQDTLIRACERIPKPKDGEDGLGFDDLTVEHDGERELTLRFMRGDLERTFSFDLPLVIDRGFWKEGAQVRKFDGMTFGGSYWIAQKDTDTKPDIGNPDWRLAVKKGRDGKDYSK